MATFPFLPIIGGPCIASHPAVSSRTLSGVGLVGTLRLPTDPIGAYVLTLSGLVIGSAVHIETAAGAALTSRTAVSATEAFTLSAYSPGSPLNNLVIKVRKASATPFYQPYQTQVVASVGAATVFVSQTPDE